MSISIGPLRRPRFIKETKGERGQYRAGPINFSMDRALSAREMHIKLILFYSKQDGNKSDKAINVLPNGWPVLPLYNFTIYMKHLSPGY